MFFLFYKSNYLFLGLSSSSSVSDISPDHDDSQSRDSVSIPREDIASSDIKPNTKPTNDQQPPEEEEGEIKDDENEEEEEENRTNQIEKEPPPPSPPHVPVVRPSTPPMKKTSNKTVIKANKKPRSGKKRKLEDVKIEPTQEQDDIDNSTLAKRKKR